jgi:hypothetical protein
MNAGYINRSRSAAAALRWASGLGMAGLLLGPVCQPQVRHSSL